MGTRGEGVLRSHSINLQPLDEALLLQILHVPYVQGSTSPQCVRVGWLLAEVTAITQLNLQPASTDIFLMASNQSLLVCNPSVPQWVTYLTVSIAAIEFLFEGSVQYFIYPLPIISESFILSVNNFCMARLLYASGEENHTSQ